MIVIKSASEIASIRQCGRIVATVLHELRGRIRPGVTTLELDEFAEQQLALMDAVSPFRGYQPDPTMPPFPGVTCMSVNAEIVHGVPGKRRLREGDVLTVDCGAKHRGWIADGAWTFEVGGVSDEARKLLETTERALYASIACARVGKRTGDVAATMQEEVERSGYNVIRHHTSHGIGRSLHEDPQILNHGRAGTGIPLRNGMTIALEPMVLSGGTETHVLDDGWTVASNDGGLTAHYEHTIAITDGEAQILTKL
ncbi:MAG: type I methionyl aminopeptidase [Anaerolineales bacterium]|nr:type I methionyl aminopeptidase [Anaerolineales bacterium]